ncbi:hypothetical protein C0995_000837 [Termitomyces sp. Mi166|nr:hypothetical protein C0995_000837 [Termitomyces sp. Mi166\
MVLNFAIIQVDYNFYGVPNSSSSVTSSSSTSSSQGNSISSTDAVAAAVASSSSSESSSTTNTATAAATNTNTLATTPTPTTTSAPITQSVYEITSNGQVSTVTSFVDGPAATSNTSRTATPTGQSFLQNKTLSGVVFALAGLFGVVAILALAIFTVRRRRNKRLLKEAISFDPTAVNEYVAEVEKDGNSARYGSSSSDYHGHNEPEAVYPFGAGQGYGHTDLGVRVPQQPERALSPQGQLRSAPREMLPNFAHGEGIGWAPDPAPFMPTQPATSYNTGDAGANRVLKIANE